MTALETAKPTSVVHRGRPTTPTWLHELALPINPLAPRPVQAIPDDTKSKKPRDESDSNYHHKAMQDHLHESDLSNVRQFAERIPPMSNKCLVSVGIPVAMCEEREFVSRAIRIFRNQTLPREQFELVLFLNRRDFDSNGRPLRQDGSIQEVKRCQKEFPDLQIRAFSHIYPRKEFSIGKVRRLLHDVILYRHLARSGTPRDHAMLRVDADTMRVGNRFLETYLRLLENDPSGFAYSGGMDFEVEAYLENPSLLVAMRAADAITVYNRNLGDRTIKSAGANVAFRASAYAHGRGFDPNRYFAEDVGFDEALYCNWLEVIQVTLLTAVHRKSFKAPHEAMDLYNSMNREGGIIPSGPHTRLTTSSRRAVLAFDMGYMPAEQWSIDKISFDSEDQSIRSGKKMRPKREPFLERIRSEAFLEDIERVIRRTLWLHSGPDPAVWRTHLDRAIEPLLGARFRIESGPSGEAPLIRFVDSYLFIELLQGWYAQHAPSGI